MRGHKMPVELMLNVYVLGERLYLPVLGKTDQGVYWPTDTVIDSELTVAKLADGLREAKTRGYPALPHPPQEALDQRTPVQERIGTSSYKRMARMGVVLCVPYWTEDSLYLAFSRRGAKDVQEIDYENRIKLPRDTAVEELAGHIIHELEGRRA